MDTSVNHSGSKSQKNTGRRSFIRKMGTVMTTGVVASTVPAVAKSDEECVSDAGAEIRELSERIAILEAEKSIVSLYHTYESLLNDCIYGGVFRGKDEGVKRLYNIRFRNSFTGKKIDTTPGTKKGYSINISVDYLSAQARFPYSMQAGSPMISDNVLVKMARLHGGGINKWCETGVCELSLTRKSKVDAWMIKRLEYRTESGSATAPPFTKTFPDDPEGPDALI
jgi:hypothetical protein